MNDRPTFADVLARMTAKPAARQSPAEMAWIMRRWGEIAEAEAKQA